MSSASHRYRLLDVHREQRVLRVRLNSPETGNAITEAVLDELLAVLAEQRADPEIRVLVLSGAGPDFSLGGDLKEFDRLTAEDPTGSGIRALSAKARQVCEGLAASDAVTIARLHGRVIGAGLALAFFCDLRAGADTCRFRMPELALGLPMAWGGALSRILQETGAARIRELVLTGNSFDASAAHRMSLLHKVVGESELDSAVEQWARPLARRPALALRVTKAALNSYSAASRLADASLLDGDLLAFVLATRDQAQRGQPASASPPPLPSSSLNPTFNPT